MHSVAKRQHDGSRVVILIGATIDSKLDEVYTEPTKIVGDDGTLWSAAKDAPALRCPQSLGNRDRAECCSSRRHPAIAGIGIAIQFEILKSKRMRSSSQPNTAAHGGRRMDALIRDDQLSIDPEPAPIVGGR